MKKQPASLASVLRLGLLCIVAWSNSLMSAENYKPIERAIPNAKLVGEARMRYLFWNVYDVALFAPNGVWDKQKPFALTLTYLRSLDGKDIAKRSIEEMQKQGFTDQQKLDKWLGQMEELFPDVKDQTVLIGIADKQQHSHFFQHDTYLGSVDDPAFTAEFFGIWLHPGTSEPALRRQLLGNTP